MRKRSGRLRLVVALISLVALLATAAPASASTGFLTSEPAFITLTTAAPSGSAVKPIISVGETVDGVLFEGIPDGIGMTDGADGTVDVYVAHEQTTIPFRGAADFQRASVTKLTLSTMAGHEGEVLAASVAIGPEAGFLRFCSASIATPAEGFDTPVFFTGEETSNIDEDIPTTAPFGADPSLDPSRQGGYAVALDTETGEFVHIPGMGRLNHENTVAIPGYNKIVTMTTDDTFTAATSQLYMYVAQNQDKLFEDEGRLYAFQVTRANGVPVNPQDAFNDANDYLDIEPGDEFEGRFIPVPKAIAEGTTDEAPQAALENWSNENNVFQFVRLEDLAYDKNDPRVVYVADTGGSRVVPNPETGRMHRPSGVAGMADNGRIFQFVLDDQNPRKVESFTVIADGDVASDHPAFVDFTSPDNIDTSANSLMVQEDTDDAAIVQIDLDSGDWTVIATVNDPDGESSGIVDASNWYGPGTWLLDVQAHGTNVDEELQPDGTLLKRESGQLMLLTIPGS